MPSISPKQRKFMAAAAHNADFAKAANIPQSVAQEFYAADKKKKGVKHKIHHMTARNHGTS